MPSSHLIFCHPLLLPPSIFPSIRVFPDDSALGISWPKYWSFSFNISPSNEHSGLIFTWISFGWISLQSRDSQESSPTPQFKSINSLALSFLIVQLSHPYMTTRKTMALTTWTFIDKVMSLLFNMLSRLVITFLPSKKQVSFNFMAAVTICSHFGASQNKVCRCFHCFSIYLP